MTTDSPTQNTQSPAARGGKNSGVAIVWDAIAVLVFAILARLAHNTEADPFTVGNVLNTWWPFLIGAVLTGVGLLAAGRDVRVVVPSGIIVWVATVVVGLGVWSVRNGAIPHWSFVLVATIMSAVVLLGWRAVASRLRSAY